MTYPTMKIRRLHPVTLLAAGGLLAAAVPSARAQYIVYDPTSHITQTLDHVEDLAKYVDMVNNQVQQIDKATQTLSQVTAYVKIVGDPSQIVNVTGVSSAVAELKSVGVSQPMAKLANAANGSSALQNTGNGLYVTVSSTTPSGSTVAHNDDLYRRYDAVDRTVSNFQAVQSDTLARIQSLRTAMKQTLAQLDAATTQTEIDKLHGVLVAQASALNDLHAEQSAAAQQAAVQTLQNGNNAQMKRQANADAFATTFNDATNKFNGGNQ